MTQPDYPLEPSQPDSPLPVAPVAPLPLARQDLFSILIALAVLKIMGVADFGYELEVV